MPTPLLRQLIALVQLFTVMLLAFLIMGLPLWIWSGGSLSFLLSWLPQQTQEEFEKDLVRKQAVGRWRGDAKKHVRTELLQGRITLREALAWYRWINNQPADQPAFCPDGWTPEKWACQDLLWACQFMRDLPGMPPCPPPPNRD